MIPRLKAISTRMLNDRCLFCMKYNKPRMATKTTRFTTIIATVFMPFLLAFQHGAKTFGENYFDLADRCGKKCRPTSAPNTEFHAAHRE
jgi:hypothetical protein